MADCFIALAHYPVYNKNREVIASALTTIDLHDLARLAATYGLAGLFLLTPLEDQIRIAKDMIRHWRQGFGAEYNPNRGEALALVRLARDIEQAEEEITREYGQQPLTVATSAVRSDSRLPFSRMAAELNGTRPILIVFGTAWGLTDQALQKCDFVLEPVLGPTPYNHLSVRSAAGIVLDRLFGRKEV